MNEGQNRDNQPLEAPAQFIHQLQTLHNRRVIVPPEVEAAILETARQHFGSIAHRHRILRLPHWLAAAAAVILAALLAMLWLPRRPGPAAFAREDLDRNRRVDILDAFALARKVRQGAVPTRFDFNGDGVVNSKDIDAIATQAVKLSPKQG